MFPLTFRSESDMTEWAKENSFGIRKVKVDQDQKSSEPILAKRIFVMSCRQDGARRDERVATYILKEKGWRLESALPANACPYCGRIAVLEPSRRHRQTIVIHKQCAQAQVEKNTERSQVAMGRRIG